jgi:hypothetical protein
MASIYCFASRLIVWLGKEADDSAFFLMMVENVAILTESKLPADRLRMSLTSFLERPWFNRVS